jgi:hypothetical protein
MGRLGDGESQVAEMMVRGMEKGRYVVHFPDTVATCITAALAGTSAPSLPLWLTILLAPITVFPQISAPFISIDLIQPTA